MIVEKKLKLSKAKIKKLNWGISGAGHFAENSFLPALQHLKKSKLVSVYSHNLERASFLSNQFNGNGGYNNYEEFLNSPIDAVFIGSVNSDHHYQTIAAATAGKHVFCEKPMAMNSDQAKEMIEACEKNNVQLAINYTTRFHPLIAKAREFIKSGMIGKLVSIQTNFNINFAPNNNFRFKMEKSGGGAFRDIGTHMIDLLRFLGGEIEEINGVIDNILYKSEVDDFASAIVKFKKSGYGHLNVTYNTERAFNRVDILGHKGCIGLENIVAAKNAPGKLTIDLAGESKKAFRRRSNKLVICLRSVQNSFLNNEKPDVDGYDGLINIKLMEELEKANNIIVPS